MWLRVFTLLAATIFNYSKKIGHMGWVTPRATGTGEFDLHAVEHLHIRE
jgi:hypothetical protein